MIDYVIKIFGYHRDNKCCFIKGVKENSYTTSTPNNLNVIFNYGKTL